MSLKENGNTFAQNQQEIAEIPWTTSDEEELGKFNTCRVY